MAFDLNTNIRGVAASQVFIAGLIVVILGIVAVNVPEAAGAILVVLLFSIICLAVFRSYTTETTFVTNVFLVGLVLRLAFGLFVHIYDLRDFFGGDALTYDFRGNILREAWLATGSVTPDGYAAASSTAGSGWGMNYLVGFIYLLLGRNILAAQAFCAVIGAATAPMVYFCTKRIYHNLQAAKFAAILVAVFPAFIIWSGQLLKDGLIIFLLVLAMTMVIELQERIGVAAVTVLGLSVAGILTLRFYIFYMVAIAVVGSFVVGVKNSPGAVLARVAVIVVLGLGLTYVGVIRNASTNLDKFGTLDKLQNSRQDQAVRADSGFGADADVSTTSGAITVIPIGFAYLMFAPFPWEVRNLRQAITLPEVIAWWALMPFLISGLIFSVKHRLRTAMPILLFSLMLTFAYSIFQSNVGTAYRQRTQIQVFLFIFIAVGWTIWKEKRDDAKLMRRNRQKRFEADLRGRQEAKL